MKKFRFKLDSVLTIRRFAKNQAASALADAQQQRSRLDSLLSEAENIREKMELDIITSYKTSSKAAEIVRRQNALHFQRKQISEIEHERQKALDHENQCREAVLLARQGEETILKLLEKEKERYRREQDKEDELAAVEFVTARHHLTNAH